MAWGFWSVLALLLILYPLTLLWAVALVDLFQREGLKRWELGVWLLAIVAVPLVGALGYLLVRPGIGSPDNRLRPARAGQTGEPFQASTRAGELCVLADLHDAGKLSDSEFAAAKVRVLRDDGGNARI